MRCGEAIVGTAEIQEEANEADSGLFPEPTFKIETIQAAVRHLSSRLTVQAWMSGSEMVASPA